MIATEEITNACINAAAALLNGGTKVYREGTTTRATFNLKATAFAAAAGGQAALDVESPTMSATVASNAVVGLDNYQFLTSLGAVRLSGDIGDLDSGADIEMNHRDVLVGDVITVDDFVLTMPTGS